MEAPDPVNITLRGPDTVNALAGGETITLSSNAEALVYGAAGDTIGSAAGTLVTFDAGTNPIILTSTGGQTLINGAAGDTLTAGTGAAQFLGATALAGNDTNQPWHRQCQCICRSRGHHRFASGYRCDV